LAKRGAMVLGEAVDTLAGTLAEVETGFVRVNPTAIGMVRNQIGLTRQPGQKLWSVSAERSFKKVGVGCAGPLTGT